MESEIEKNFVQACIVKIRRDRLLYELSGKKRKDGIGRFCHHADELLRPDKIIASDNHLCYDDICKIVKAYTDSGLWHIIAYHEELDRKKLPLQEALKLILGNGMAAIAISETMAIVETEQCDGTPVRYILRYE